MDISILRECVDLADTLNFTKTARRFYVSQPTLSNHITNLENEIGAQIVQRSKNGLALTKAGKVFVQGAEKMLREYDRVLAEVSLVQSGKDEVVRFGCLDCAVETFLAPALHAFARAHPSTPVLYSSYQVHEVLKALDANEIDVAVTTAFSRPIL